MTEDNGALPPKLELIDGQGSDPEDYSDQIEELEALDIRLMDNITVLERKYPPPVNDDTLRVLLQGFRVIEGLASEGGELDIPQSVDASIKAYIKRVEHGAPEAIYKSASEEESRALKFLNSALFNTFFADFKADHPSEAWSDEESVNAISEAIAHTSAIIRALYPQEAGEEPLEYTHRLQKILDDASDEISKLPETAQL